MAFASYTVCLDIRNIGDGIFKFPARQCFGSTHGLLCAGIFEQSVGVREPNRNRVVVPACQATQAVGIDSLESIPGPLKCLKIPSLISTHGLFSRV